QCNLHAHTAWSAQLPTLIDAYLLWKHGSCESDAENCTEYVFDVCCIGIIGIIQAITRVLCALHNINPCIFHSNYFIPEAPVEHFKDDMRTHPGQHSPHQNTSCTENWTAARSVEEAKISVFQQTGIFIMACHHGLVECIVEMKCSKLI
ncbi:hypothetical protein BDR04DRAFT_1025385, partial [Suillus decipiens]